MSTVLEMVTPVAAHAFRSALSPESLRAIAPAVYGESARPQLSERYTFIPTERVLDGLARVGFVPVQARQVRAKVGNGSYARHLIRLQRRFETVQLKDAIPEIVLLNSHDGSSAYHLKLGLYRVVCTNGLMVAADSFPGIRVSHRKDIVDEVVTGALELAERFEELAGTVEQMRQRLLYRDEQLQLAQQALALRYPDPEQQGMAASQLLFCRRDEDARESVWNILNRLQENVLRGGFIRHSPSGRLTRMRRLSSLREEVRVNCCLWSLAASYLDQ